MKKIALVGVAVVFGAAMMNGCVIKTVDGSGGGSSQSTTGSGAGTTTSSTGSYTTSSGHPTTGSGMVTSCDVAAGDDSCVSCEKKSCCNEIQACDADGSCSGEYQAWFDCLYPDGQNPSGYTGNYCAAAATKMGSAARALIDCIDTKCNTDGACGNDTVTWDNFAAGFIEDFCAACHFPGFVAPDGKDVPGKIPQFSDDANWSYWPCPDADPKNCATQTGPRFNPDWKTPGLGVSYEETTQAMASMTFPANDKVPDKIWCGVSNQLPSECATEFPMKFPTAKRFPPAGTDPNKSTCEFNTPMNGACPQPTEIDRNKMSSWIFDGMAK
jgi:hypothetical protein